MRTYHSKILLFGEYSLMMGSLALGIPYRPYKAGISAGDDLKRPGSRDQRSNAILKQYYESYLILQPGLHTVIDMEKLGKDIGEGLCIESDIPVKRGLGSSGALCAAIYGHYAFDPVISWAGQVNGNWRSLRNTFITMESWFHLRSSGFDALLSYLDQPLLLFGDGAIKQVSFPGDVKALASVFLVNTGTEAGTAEQVRNFLKDFFGKSRQSVQGKELISLNNFCVNTWLGDDKAGFAMAMKELSEFQLVNMSRLIPGNMREIWSVGLKNDSFYLKICGSGGGGFLLGFSGNPVKASETMRVEGLETINVEHMNKHHDKYVDQGASRRFWIQDAG